MICIPPKISPRKYRNAPPIPVSPRLDLSTVKSYTPRLLEETPSDPRPFGLTDCPEFYPTVEEFKDPMAYIKSISPKAKDYGICKTVPPQGWKIAICDRHGGLPSYSLNFGTWLTIL